MNRESESSSDRLLHYMVSCGIDDTELLTWPAGILLPIQDHLHKCSNDPDMSLPTAALKLLGKKALTQLCESILDFRIRRWWFNSCVTAISICRENHTECKSLDIKFQRKLRE